jgi:predicted nucleic acid-binding protein
LIDLHSCGDIVIDTNVLCHASDPRQARQEDAVNLLECLRGAAGVSLAIDPDGSLDEAVNRSQIIAEYLQYLPPGTLGRQLLQHLAASSRLRFHEPSLSVGDARWLNQLLRNRMDRVFVKVAANSQERVLVSHDYEDFQKRKRQDIKKRLGVRICEACDCQG